MSAVLTVAGAAIKEHSRRRLIVFFVVVSLLITGVLVYVTRDQSAQQVFGPASGIATFAALGVLQFFALLGALTVSMGNIGAPFASGEALLILARPVTRWQFAMGRFIGSVSLIAGFCALMAVETQTVKFVAGGGWEANLWLHWAVDLFNLSLIAALTTLLSALIPVPVLTALVAFFVNQGVQAVSGFHRIVRAGMVRGTFADIIELMWWVTPKFLTSPLEEAQARSLTGDPGAVLDIVVPNTPGLAAAAFLWLVGLLGLSLVLTSRKEA